MIAVVGSFRLPLEALEKARPLMLGVIEATLAEPGCRAYSYAEDVKERLERELSELLEELRVLIPGAEVLFGFLLAIRFTSQFSDLTTVQEYVYYLTLLSTAVALVLLLAPAVHHRVRFREGEKEYLVRKANREAIADPICA